MRAGEGGEDMLRYGVAFCLAWAAVLELPAAQAKVVHPETASGRESSTRVYRIHLDEPGGADPGKSRSLCPKLPRTLYIRVERNKEWSPGNRRAWAYAVASTREDFGDRFLFRVIRLRIGVPARITSSVREKTCRDATTCWADSYFRGTTKREFVADWYIEAHDGICLEPWSVSERW